MSDTEEPAVKRHLEEENIEKGNINKALDISQEKHQHPKEFVEELNQNHIQRHEPIKEGTENEKDISVGSTPMICEDKKVVNLKCEADTTVTTEEPAQPAKRRAKHAQPTRRVDIIPPRPDPTVPATNSSVSLSSTSPSSPSPTPNKDKHNREDEQSEKAEEQEEGMEGEECEDEKEEEDEAAKVIRILGSLMDRVYQVLVLCLNMLYKGLLLGMKYLYKALPILFSIALFSLMVYSIVNYALQEVEQSDLLSYDARLKFLLRCEIWPILPVFIGAVIGWITPNECHSRFSRTAFEQALLFLFNLLLVSTHIPTQGLVWVRACAITMGIFSFLHWSGTMYTKKHGNLFVLPGLLVNFVAMATNLYVIFGQDLGYVIIEPRVTSISTQTGYTGGSSYWDQVTVCNLVERVFCKV